MVGTWILKEAVFRNQIDLDGPGPGQTTTDAKSLIYDLLDVYSNCSSDAEIVFEFSDDPPIWDHYSLYKEKSLFAVCPEGFGITAWIADYTFDDGTLSRDKPYVIVYKEEVNDPADFINDGNLIVFFKITGEIITDDKYSISGECISSFISNYPDHNPDMSFDWVMERVDTH